MQSEEFSFTPKVDEAQEFIEIAFDFSSPLELVREAISNAFDANANKIKIGFDVIDEYGEKTLLITIEDNGIGMNEKGLESFFDLGNSMHKDDSAIGEKGHGTKVYFNSEKIEVVTVRDGIKYDATMNKPRRDLFNHIIPEVNVTKEEVNSESSGTKIYIWGYFNNRRDKFRHTMLKDYILWFTKFGSVEKEFGITDNSTVALSLKGVDCEDYEELSFGHIFPEESKKVDDLLDDYLVDAPKWYCKKFVKTGRLKSMPEIEYNAVFYVEGTRVKYSYNKMIQHPGYTSPPGSYTIQERYGIWLCKDFIPIQQKNEWITSKGSESTKFHAFINCQALRLTANRGSVDNTPSEILSDLKDVVYEIYTEITQGSDWFELEWLESEASVHNSSERDQKAFKHRIDNINRTKVADYKGIHLVEPRQENGVFAIFMQLSDIDEDDEDLFPFTILDYDTHVGIDVIVKAKNDDAPIKSLRLYYVEFKNHLSKDFNHAFKNIYSIVCWDINTNELAHGEEIMDIAGEVRTLKIIPPSDEKDYTRYYLDSSRSEKKIEVFVLSTYLKEKCGIEFVPRTEDAVF